MVYNLLFLETCGMFTPLHFAAIFLCFLLLFAALCCSRRLNVTQTNRLLFWLGIVVAGLEILKIANRAIRGYHPGRWIPLFYCSLFVFAVWLIRLPGKICKRMGSSFICMGGGMAAIFFLFYPSTSLASYPLISFDSLHSLLYHLIMCYCSVMMLWKGIYKPVKQDGVWYFIFVAGACILSVPINEAFGTNCMFMRHPYGLPILQPVMDYSQTLYRILAAFGQSVVMFWLNFGIFTLVDKKVHKKTAVY